MRVPFFLPLQYLLSFLKIIFISTLDVKQLLIVVFICIFLMTDDVEHLFMLILAIYISSLERCLFKSFAYFLIELFAIMYNFACKYSKNCRSPDLNGIGFGHVEAQSNCPFESADHTELGSASATAYHAELGWPWSSEKGTTASSKM